MSQIISRKRKSDDAELESFEGLHLLKKAAVIHSLLNLKTSNVCTGPVKKYMSTNEVIIKLQEAYQETFQNNIFSHLMSTDDYSTQKRLLTQHLTTLLSDEVTLKLASVGMDKNEQDRRPEKFGMVLDQVNQLYDQHFITFHEYLSCKLDSNQSRLLFSRNKTTCNTLVLRRMYDSVGCEKAGYAFDCCLISIFIGVKVLKHLLTNHQEYLAKLHNSSVDLMLTGRGRHCIYGRKCIIKNNRCGVYEQDELVKISSVTSQTDVDVMNNIGTHHDYILTFINVMSVFALIPTTIKKGVLHILCSSDDFFYKKSFDNKALRSGYKMCGDIFTGDGGDSKSVCKPACIVSYLCKTSFTKHSEYLF